MTCWICVQTRNAKRCSINMDLAFLILKRSFTVPNWSRLIGKERNKVCLKVHVTRMENGPLILIDLATDRVILITDKVWLLPLLGWSCCMQQCLSQCAELDAPTRPYTICCPLTWVNVNGESIWSRLNPWQCQRYRVNYRFMFQMNMTIDSNLRIKSVWPQCWAPVIQRSTINRKNWWCTSSHDAHHCTPPSHWLNCV